VFHLAAAKLPPTIYSKQERKAVLLYDAIGFMKRIGGGANNKKHQQIHKSAVMMSKVGALAGKERKREVMRSPSPRELFHPE
jgi:hypothetical protein